MIIPEINTVCAYDFQSPFNTLNNIYTLVDIRSFSKALTDGIDFVANLYTPAGVSSDQFTTDEANYTNDIVLHLVPVNDGVSEIYVPSTLLGNIPDAMVGCYNDLAIGVHLGLYADQDTLSWILSELNSLISAAAGVNNPAKLYSLGTKYMKVADYEALQASRQAAMSSYQTLYQQLQQQIALTRAAQNLVTYYEDTYVTLASSGG